MSQVVVGGSIAALVAAALARVSITSGDPVGCAFIGGSSRGLPVSGGREAFESAYSRTGKFTDAPFVEAGTRLKELVDLQPFQTAL